MALGITAWLIETRSSQVSQKASGKVQVLTGIEWALCVTLFVVSIFAMSKGYFSPAAAKICFYVGVVNAALGMICMSVMCRHNRKFAFPPQS